MALDDSLDNGIDIKKPVVMSISRPILIDGKRAYEDSIFFLKGEHKYLFRYVYTPKNRREMLRAIGRLTSDPEFNLDWPDSAKISYQIERLKNSHKDELRFMH